MIMYSAFQPLAVFYLIFSSPSPSLVLFFPFSLPAFSRSPAHQQLYLLLPLPLLHSQATRPYSNALWSLSKDFKQSLRDLDVKLIWCIVVTVTFICNEVAMHHYIATVYTCIIMREANTYKQVTNER